jgi:SAM-dependent methyltransferase
VRSALSGERFGAEWLALREPYDTRAVAPDLVRRLVEWVTARPGLRVVDLGAGTGAMLRRLGPLLGEGQQWTLAELDPELIMVGQARLGAGLPPAAYWHLDLARDLEALGGKPVNLITASALLDLVSVDWLGRLARLRARLDCALYVALTYHGHIEWEPADPFDGLALNAINRHQRGDKGFGLALGPDAAPALARMLGGGTELARSNWWLGPGDRAMQRALIKGYTGIADNPALQAWAKRRRAYLQARRSALTVEHLDLLYLPGVPSLSSRTA